MLGNVARKLRIFGYDTLYVAHVEDSEVLKIGIDQARIILTADKEFFKRIVKAKAQGVLVGGANEVDDLVHIFEKNGIGSVDDPGMVSRCALCNGELVVVDLKNSRSELPEKVAANHKTGFRCTSCGKVYWEGSHMKRIKALARTIDIRLALISKLPYS